MTLSFFVVAEVVNCSRKDLERTLEPSETALLRLEGGMVTYSLGFYHHIFSCPGRFFPLPEMEFLQINLTKDSSLFALHVIHSLSKGRFLKRTRHYRTLDLKIQKNPPNKKTQVFS
jgi:hypothetical protein